MDYEKIDEALMPVHNYVTVLFDIEASAGDEEWGVKMEIDEVSIDMPVQMDIIVSDDGQVTIGVSPPLHYVATGIEPVFHRISVRSVLTKEHK
jgi:hypothetical protein